MKGKSIQQPAWDWPLHPATHEWLTQVFERPTPAQEQAWPAVAAGENTLLLAPTGSGKTLAAFLIAIDRLMFGTPFRDRNVAQPLIASGASQPTVATASAPLTSASTVPTARGGLQKHRQTRRGTRAGVDPTPESAAADASSAGVRVLYISPLKALGVDVERNLKSPLAGIRAVAQRRGDAFRAISVGIRSGDTPASERVQLTRQPPDILITTPESLYLLLTSRARDLLATVETVIIDEIHSLVATKRGAHLFLSLERLERFRQENRQANSDQPLASLQRIGLSATQRPLDEVARLLGGATASANPDEPPIPRPVSVIEAGTRKPLDLRIEVPVEDMTRLGEVEVEFTSGPAAAGPSLPSIWPSIYPRLVELIRQHRSTMIFVNSRRLAERLAAALNELAEQELALAHHGSIAKDARAQIEDRLKRGQLPAIVATSSLELGIDMGAVDLVIQIEAPPSIASGLQRIGRAGHQVGARSKGIVFPKYRGDLLACSAAAGRMFRGEVEETFYPRNPLDVLAQQLVAMTAAGPQAVDQLYATVRAAAPFADLPRTSFESVLDLLAGRYPSDEFAELRPRLNWDRVAGIVSPRKSTQRLAILNAGTIPDRGLYGVFMADGSEGQGESGASFANPSATRSQSQSASKSSGSVASSSASFPGSDGADHAPSDRRDRTRYAARGRTYARGGRRVGELDEEMVFETRPGDIFLLGASSWRVVDITNDRVLVIPAPGEPGRMPFWRGDGPGRPLEFGRAIGALTRRLVKLDAEVANQELVTEHALDERAASNLLRYLYEQQEATGVVPSDKTIVVECFVDEVGDWRVAILSPFGARVHAPWATAVRSRLASEATGEVDMMWTDDGILFRLPESDSPPDWQTFFPKSHEVESLILQQVGSTALFAARFRENAARALLLPKRQPGQRTPLWLQRRRAADLLSVAARYPAFPILLETYRECLRDVFDLRGLQRLLQEVEQRSIRVKRVETGNASPFASSLMFNYIGNFIYEGDAPLAERRAATLALDHSQLRELLGDAELRTLLDADAIDECACELQRLDSKYPIRDADGIHALLLYLGDLTADEIVARCGRTEPHDVATQSEAALRWLDELVESRRVIRIKLGEEVRYGAAEDTARFRDALGLVPPLGMPAAFLESVAEPLVDLVSRYARTHVPFTIEDVARRFRLGVAVIRAALQTLQQRGRVLEGEFLPGGRGREWCDAEVLKKLKRRSLARLRQQIEPVEPTALARFLPLWHGLDRPRRGLDGLLDVIEQLQGMPLPASDLERYILPARVQGYRPSDLDELCAAGEVVWRGVERLGETDGRIALYLTDHLVKLVSPAPPLESSLASEIGARLAERGAMFFEDLVRATGQFRNDLLEVLWELVWNGDVTNDTLAPLRALRRDSTVRRASGNRRERGFRSRRTNRLPGSEGRWTVLVRPGDVGATPTERQAALATQLLERYGIVTREMIAGESPAGGFSGLYPVFKALEEAGRIRRGYFVAGQGAAQFAIPGAEDRLRSRPHDEENPARPLILAATDPANAYGTALSWPERTGDETARPARAAGARVILYEGELIGYLTRTGDHLLTFQSDAPHRSPELDEHLVTALASLANETTAVYLTKIDGHSPDQSPLASHLRAHGFIPTSRGWLHRRTT